MWILPGRWARWITQRRIWEQFLVEVPLFSTFRPNQRGELRSTMQLCGRTARSSTGFGHTFDHAAPVRCHLAGKIADALNPIRYASGERIITQGEAGDLFYIVESGTVVITEDATDKRLEFGRGKFFGEISLIQVRIACSYSQYITAFHHMRPRADSFRTCRAPPTSPRKATCAASRWTARRSGDCSGRRWLISWQVRMRWYSRPPLRTSAPAAAQWRSRASQSSWCA
jgi:hypothetical protein